MKLYLLAIVCGTMFVLGDVFSYSLKGQEIERRNVRPAPILRKENGEMLGVLPMVDNDELREEENEESSGWKDSTENIPKKTIENKKENHRKSDQTPKSQSFKKKKDQTYLPNTKEKSKMGTNAKENSLFTSDFDNTIDFIDTPLSTVDEQSDEDLNETFESSGSLSDIIEADSEDFEAVYVNSVPPTNLFPPPNIYPLVAKHYDPYTFPPFPQMNSWEKQWNRGPQSQSLQVTNVTTTVPIVHLQKRLDLTMECTFSVYSSDNKNCSKRLPIVLDTGSSVAWFNPYFGDEEYKPSCWANAPSEGQHVIKYGSGSVTLDMVHTHFCINKPGESENSGICGPGILAGASHFDKSTASTSLGKQRTGILGIGPKYKPVIYQLFLKQAIHKPVIGLDVSTELRKGDIVFGSLLPRYCVKDYKKNHANCPMLETCYDKNNNPQSHCHPFDECREKDLSKLGKCPFGAHKNPCCPRLFRLPMSASDTDHFTVDGYFEASNEKVNSNIFPFPKVPKNAYNPLGSSNFIIDSGTSLVLLPEEIYNRRNFWIHLYGERLGSLVTSAADDEIPTFPCSVVRFSEFTSLHFKFFLSKPIPGEPPPATVTFTLKPRDYIMNATHYTMKPVDGEVDMSLTESLCSPIFSKTKKPGHTVQGKWILGLTFMHKFYSTFQYGTTNEAFAVGMGHYGSERHLMWNEKEVPFS
eukprot:Nk52_evm42s255 gene=Nk52_evmTU42s255